MSVHVDVQLTLSYTPRVSQVMQSSVKSQQGHLSSVGSLAEMHTLRAAL